MITKVKSNIISLVYNVLFDKKFSDMNHPRKYFIAYTIWLFVAIKGRLNFRQMKRFCKFCELYYRIGF